MTEAPKLLPINPAELFGEINVVLQKHFSAFRPDAILDLVKVAKGFALYKNPTPQPSESAVDALHECLTQTVLVPSINHLSRVHVEMIVENLAASGYHITPIAQERQTLTATVYRFDDDTTIELRTKSGVPELWAVMQHGSALSKKGGFDCEPLPSSL